MNRFQRPLVACANTLASVGQFDLAIEVYDVMASCKVPSYVIADAQESFIKKITHKGLAVLNKLLMLNPKLVLWINKFFVKDIKKTRTYKLYKLYQKIDENSAKIEFSMLVEKFLAFNFGGSESFSETWENSNLLGKTLYGISIVCLVATLIAGVFLGGLVAGGGIIRSHLLLRGIAMALVNPLELAAIYAIYKVTLKIGKIVYNKFMAKHKDLLEPEEDLEA